MIQEVHKVTSARYSQEDPRDIVYIIQNMPLGAGNQPCWQTALLANCPADKFTSETVGKLPCWQTALLTNLLQRLLENGPYWQTAPAGKLPCWQTALLAKRGPEIVVRSGRCQKQNSFAAGRISAGTRYSAPRCACARENRAGNPIEFQEILLPVLHFMT